MSVDSMTVKPARTLILCFDGTTNHFDGDNTNVVQFYSLLKKDNPEQLCYYQPGVGTYIQPGVVSPLFQWGAKVLDEAVAWYLNEHVRGGYRFLMQNYRPRDKVCIFGFSRGAYTARALAGFLHKIGLLPKDNPEQVPMAYKLYERTDSKGIELAKGFKKTFCRDIKVEFLGVWDTVASVGVLRSKVLPFTLSNQGIKVFRHALALDERRAKFRPSFYRRATPPTNTVKREITAKDGRPVSMSPQDMRPSTETETNSTYKGDTLRGDASLPVTDTAPATKLAKTSTIQTIARKGTVAGRTLKKLFTGGGSSAGLRGEYAAIERPVVELDPTDVKEVWFAGCHGDVGGGSVENSVKHSLALISLRWMVREVADAQCGIQFDSDALADAHIPPTVFSRSNFPLERYFNHTQRPGLVVRTTEPDMSEKESLSRSHGIASFFKKAKRPAVDPSDDAVQPMSDQLKASWLWWLLEVMPTDYTWQDERGVWHRRWGSHMGRGRDVPGPNPLFHESVKRRMESNLNYRPAAVWERGTERYVS